MIEYHEVHCSCIFCCVQFGEHAVLHNLLASDLQFSLCSLAPSVFFTQTRDVMTLCLCSGAQRQPRGDEGAQAAHRSLHVLRRRPLARDGSHQLRGAAPSQLPQVRQNLRASCLK